MNISDANDAYLGGKAKIDNWQRDFTRQWYEPQISLMMSLAVQQLSNLPPAVRQQLQQKSPGAWADLMKGVNNGRV